MTTRRCFLNSIAFVFAIFCGRRFYKRPQYVLLIPRLTYKEYADARILFDQIEPELPHLFFYPIELSNALDRGEIFTYDNTTIFPQPKTDCQVRMSIPAFFHPQAFDRKKIDQQIADLVNKAKHAELWLALEKLKRGELDKSGLFIYV